jgi:hypothetical protein
VELPSWRFSWESYHSEENQGANADYPAPSLVDYLQLRRVGPAIDLADAAGRPGMLYRTFGDRSDWLRSHLLYLRADLLRKYLNRVGRSLVWINWGERTLNYKTIEAIRTTCAAREVWDRHTHIHKQFVVYE